MLIPVLAASYDAVCRYEGSAASAWSAPEWRARFIPVLIFTAEGSAIVGLAAGGLGLWILHSRRRTAFSHFAICGGGLGAFCGVLITGLLQNPGDSYIAWLIFITLPAISMALGFACYWFLYVRHRAAHAA